MNTYNYDGFNAKSYNLDNFHGPDLGTKVTDFKLSSTDGSDVQLLDFEGEFLVLELGSITCPLFQGRRDGMASLVDKYSNISFAVLYIREAHPGDLLPAHKTFEEKTNCAQSLSNDGEHRKILIDDLAGSAHAYMGSYPNAVFIINKNGCVVFRSDWNSVPATGKALDNLLQGKPATNASYFLPVKPWVAIRTLRKSGSGAVSEFLQGLPQLIWKNLIRRNFLLWIGSGDRVAPDASC